VTASDRTNDSEAPAKDSDPAAAQAPRVSPDPAERGRLLDGDVATASGAQSDPASEASGPTPSGPPEGSLGSASAPLPPAFWFIFDWRLLASLAVIGLTAAISCDVVNAKAQAAADRLMGHSVAVPNAADWTPGSTHTIELTLVTKDADRLACADDRTFGDLRCQYNKERRRFPRDGTGPLDDNDIHIIAPYRTATGNVLVMVAGLWATPDLAMRRHMEPARGRADKDLARFIARCDLQFVDRIDGVQVRWDFKNQWYTENVAPMARALSCAILEEH